MGLILDSSVVIAAERRGETAEQLLQRVLEATEDQEAALSAIGLTELVHGIHRANTAERRARREAFIDDLLSVVTVYPFADAARLAGKIDAEQQVKSVVIPLGDLLISATALSLRYSVGTVNLRHFRKVPGLTVVQF